MRIAFLGTPDFAIPSFQMLIDQGIPWRCLPIRTGLRGGMGP